MSRKSRLTWITEYAKTRLSSTVSTPELRVEESQRAGHLMDTLCDSRLPIHENAQVVGIEHEQARSSDGGHGRRPARAAQRRDLTEEMTGAEPNALVLEFDFHLSIRDEIHK